MFRQLSIELSHSQKNNYFNEAQRLLFDLSEEILWKLWDDYKSEAPATRVARLSVNSVAIQQFIDTIHAGFKRKATVRDKDKAICYQWQLAKYLVEKHANNVIIFDKETKGPVRVKFSKKYIELITAYFNRCTEINDIQCICHTTEDIQAYKLFFKYNTTISVVENYYLSFSLGMVERFYAEQSEALADILSTNRTIRTVRIGCSHHNDDIKVIVDAIVNNGCVQVLEIDGILIRKTLSEYLAHAFTVKTSALKAVSITNIYSTCEYDYIYGLNHVFGSGQDCILILKSIFEQNTIERLTLKYAGICDDVMIELGRLLRFNNSVKALSISNEKFSANGMKAFCEGLLLNSSLQELHIKNTPIGEEGAKLLALNLVENNSLKELNLSGSHLEKEGCLAVLHALISTPYTKKCHLWVKTESDAVELNAELQKIDKNNLKHLLLEISGKTPVVAQRLSAYHELYRQNLLRLKIQSQARLFLTRKCGPEVAGTISFFAVHKRARDEQSDKDNQDYNDALSPGCFYHLKRPALSYK